MKHLAIVLLVIIAIHSCKKEDPVFPPVVVTMSVDEIQPTTAQVGGNVISDGGLEVTDRGVYWGTSSNPETTGTKLSLGTGVGIFMQTLTGLAPGIQYYVKAYAQNSKGLAYGNETIFTTQINLAQVTTTPVVALTQSSVAVGGEVLTDGGFQVSERGVFWGESENAQLSGQRIVIGSGLGVFSTNLENLARGTTYYVRAFAKNIKGTSYGQEFAFTTEQQAPTVKTLIPKEVTISSALIGGQLLSDGGGSITAQGVYWGTTTQPQTDGVQLPIASENEFFEATISDLNPGSTYYVIAFASNAVGTSYGDVVEFITQGEAPTAETVGFSDLTSTSVTLKGFVSANNLTTNVLFEYGTTTSYGSSVVAEESPVNNDFVDVTANVSGLSPNTVYHYRVVAQNALGTEYGGDSIFTTVITGITGTVSDIDNNTYATIGIGYQVWMTENLRTTKYRNGDDIPIVESDSIWNILDSPGLSWFNNDSLTYYSNLGALYNWYAIETNNICPTGWKVPTKDDFAELVAYIGGSGIAGGLLKQVGTTYWQDPNKDATNTFGFFARGGGRRDQTGVFDFRRVEGNWWTQSNYSNFTASYLYIIHNYSNTFEGYINKRNGMSVRCVKE